jgi:hypothetical protein
MCEISREEKNLQAGSTREKKGLVRGAETLPQQVINNSAAVQQERGSIRPCVCSVITSCAASLSQQEKNNSADMQRSRVNFTGCICTVAR